MAEAKKISFSISLGQALSEGSIDPGGNVEGFLYFQKVNAEVP
jgi:hypothetical protein